MSMPVKLLWLGKYVLNWPDDPHQHVFFQIMLCVAGRGTLELADRILPVSVNQLYILPPGTIHKAATEDGSLRVIDLKFEINDPNLAQACRALPTVMRMSEGLATVGLLGNVLEELLQKQPEFELCANAYLTALLIRLIRRDTSPPKPLTAPLSETDFAQSVEYKGVQFQQIIQYIHDNLHRRITLEELARLASINRSYFDTVFRQLFGVPPMRYIARTRLELARMLLEESALSVTEIAERAGYQSIHYFSKSFKKSQAMSPSEYRAKHRSNHFVNIHDEGSPM